MELVSVAAVAENRVIGNDGELPWESIPADKEQYRGRIADDPVILGRRTFDSMRDDLPGRAQVVLSRSDRTYDVETAVRAGGVDEAIESAAQYSDVAYVIGGAKTYELFQPHADRMVLSHVPGEYEGDAFYPAWDEDSWSLRQETAYDRFTLRVYERTQND